MMPSIRLQNLTAIFTCVLFLSALSFVFSSIPAHALTFNVNSNGDQEDANIGDNQCQTTLGTCTLRAAVEEVSASNASTHLIFLTQLPANEREIILTSSLNFTPSLVNSSLQIVGPKDSQGHPIVRITGDGSFDGLVSEAKNFTVDGIALGNFQTAVSAKGSLRVVNSYIGVDTDRATPLSNTTGVSINNTNATFANFDVNIDLKNNIIAHNSQNGVEINTTSSAQYRIFSFQNNYIGTNENGDNLGNGGHGIFIDGATNYVQGSALAIGDYTQLGDSGAVNGNFGDDFANVISGNGKSGIYIEDSENVYIAQNIIGATPDGQAALPNQEYGIGTYEVEGLYIGDTEDPLLGNLISGNGKDGVWTYNNGPTSILGNRIGTDVTGLQDIGNGRHGIYIDQGFDFEPPDIPQDFRMISNLISGNDENGIMLQDLGDYKIIDNTIGLDLPRTSPLGNGLNGVCLNGSDNNQIGGQVDDGNSNVQSFDVTFPNNGGNYIAGNVANGINIMEASENTEIIGNYIGTNENGDTGLGNGENGVRVIEGSTGVSVGNGQVTDSNIIYSNQADGVRVGDSAGGNESVSIGKNSFKDNGGQGINIVQSGENATTGINRIDGEDGGTGPNGAQNFPVLTEVVQNGNDLDLRGFLYSAPNTDFIIDLYRSADNVEAATDREGELWLAENSVTTDASGVAEFIFTLDLTDSDYNTFTSGDNFTVFASEQVLVNLVPTRQNTSEFGTQGQAGAEIDIATNMENFVVGEEVVYSVVVENTGELLNRNAQLTLDLGRDLEFVPGSCDECQFTAPDSLTFTIDSQPPSTSQTFAFRARVLNAGSLTVAADFTAEGFAVFQTSTDTITVTEAPTSNTDNNSNDPVDLIQPDLENPETVLIRTGGHSQWP